MQKPVRFERFKTCIRRCHEERDRKMRNYRSQAFKNNLNEKKGKMVTVGLSKD
jgi:hypothetical protein